MESNGIFPTVVMMVNDSVKDIFTDETRGRERVRERIRESGRDSQGEKQSNNSWKPLRHERNGKRHLPGFSQSNHKWIESTLTGVKYST